MKDKIDLRDLMGQDSEAMTIDYAVTPSLEQGKKELQAFREKYAILGVLEPDFSALFETIDRFLEEN